MAFFSCWCLMKKLQTCWKSKWYWNINFILLWLHALRGFLSNKVRVLKKKTLVVVCRYFTLARRFMNQASDQESGTPGIAVLHDFHQNATAFQLRDELQRGSLQYDFQWSPGQNRMALTPAVGVAGHGRQSKSTVKYIQLSQRQVMSQ